MPRGTGIVTRRPLVLQLINRPASAKANGNKDEKPGEFFTDCVLGLEFSLGYNADNTLEDAMANAKIEENNADEWGEFLHLPGQKFHDFGKIRDEIVRDTEKMTGKNAGMFGLFVPHETALTWLRYLTEPNQPQDLFAKRSHAHVGRFARSDQSPRR